MDTRSSSSDHALPAALEPGSWVRHPGEPAWGAGQVQSVIGERVTVNFDNVGKILVNATRVTLEVLAVPPER